MLINTARFITSSPTLEKAPATDRHEYAFIGRSNVGKSSLINMLTGKKGLAMTSATPGKTMLINHFLINDSWYIVDLPGYGFALRSKKELAKINEMIRSYILGREQMTNLFLLIDSRHAPQKIDIEFMQWLGENGVPFSIVFTKLDKQSKQKAAANMAAYCEKLLEEWEELPPIFATSATKGTGREEILNYIEQLNKLPLASEPNSAPVVNNIENINTDTIKPDTMDTKKCTRPADVLPGAATDIADNEKVDPEMVKEDVKELNDNPRDNDL